MLMLMIEEIIIDVDGQLAECNLLTPNLGLEIIMLIGIGIKFLDHYKYTCPQWFTQLFLFPCSDYIIEFREVVRYKIKTPLWNTCPFDDWLFEVFGCNHKFKLPCIKIEGPRRSSCSFGGHDPDINWQVFSYKGTKKVFTARIQVNLTPVLTSIQLNQWLWIMSDQHSKKLSSQFGYYKCKPRRINESTKNYQSLVQAWMILDLKRFLY